jgi:hypothetical protein
MGVPIAEGDDPRPGRSPRVVGSRITWVLSTPFKTYALLCSPPQAVQEGADGEPCRHACTPHHGAGCWWQTGTPRRP